ncbi:unnamed protein product [Paramecium sonneborni]|uniref:Uncharacterized protein n=1 Tax=Paramecium sonneborni TaxID=65129 RepID=A0A8S1LK58_9CILI|nr:unnamed protein product [Paramecium sonneborni]
MNRIQSQFILEKCYAEKIEYLWNNQLLVQVKESISKIMCRKSNNVKSKRDMFITQ